MPVAQLIDEAARAAVERHEEFVEADASGITADLRLISLIARFRVTASPATFPTLEDH